MLYRHPDFPYRYIRPKAIRQAWLAKKSMLRRVGYGGGAALFVTALAAMNILILPRASAITPRPAIDEVGQTDKTYNNPNYTAWDVDNNTTTPPGNHIGFDYPYSTSLDPVNHRLFVADNQNSRVVVYDLDNSNHLTSLTANNAIGEPDFVNENVPFTITDCFSGSLVPSQSTMCEPGIVLYDSTNQRLFVSDTAWKRILVYDLSGGVTDGMTASYVIGQPDFTTKTCTVSQSSVCSPDGMAYDSANSRLFVSDNQRVMVFDLSSGITNGMNASWVLGQSLFTASSCGAIGQSTVCGAWGLSYDSGAKTLYVANQTWNRVSIFDLSGGISNNMNASSELGQPDFTSLANGGSTCYSSGTPAQNNLCYPYGLDFDASVKRLYVTDSYYNRVMVWDLSGAVTNGMNAAHVLGQSVFTTKTSNTRFASATLISNPNYVTVDAADSQVIVTDPGYERVLVYDISGGLSDGMAASKEIGQASFGTTTQNFALSAANNANPNPTGFNYPEGVKIDPIRHRMFVSDTENNRVLVFNLDNSNNLIDHTADYVLGEPDLQTTYYDCWTNPAGSITQSSTCEPTSLEIDTADNLLFVADYESVARVLVYDLSGGITNGMNASYVIGQPDFTTGGEHCNASTDQSHFCDLGGLVYDTNHKRLFVSDENNNRVMVFDLSSGITNGMNASWVLGQANFTDNQCNYGLGTPSASSICFLDIQDMEGLDYDQSTDTLFVADSLNDRVLTFDLSGGISNNMNASHVVGQPNFTSQGCATSQTRLCWAYNVIYDPVTKKMFVSDNQNSRVMIWDLWNGITDGMAAQSQIGQADFTHKVFDVSQTNLDTPYGIDYDSTTGKLYVVDSFNDRVTIYKIGLSIDTSTLPTGETGAAYSASLTISDQSGSPTFTISSGSLPPGLGIDGSTGDITGTPTLDGDYPFTVQVTDPSGQTATKNLSIMVTHPYSATDLLGQVDGGGAPIWNQSAVNNNAGSVNADGLNYPDSTVIDTIRHRLFVSDGNNRVLVYNLDSSNNLIDHTADYVLGQPDMTSGGDNANCDWNGGIPSASNMCSPEGISFDEANNRLFVPDNYESRILVFDFSGGISSGMAASNVLGQPNLSGFGCATTQAGLCNPWGGTVYDPLTHYLYVSDLGNHRVIVYDLSSGISDGMNAAYVIGEPDFNTAGNWGILPSQNNVIGSYALALDSAGHRLFVADWNDGGRVMVFDTAALSNNMAASHVLGEKDFVSYDSASDNGDPPDAKSFGPTGLAYDSRHNWLFVSDDNAYRVLIFDTNSITDNEDAVGVLGQLDFSTNDTSCTTSQTSLCDPEGVDQYYDTANQRLYLADSNNNRIMIYDFARLASPAATGTVGSAYSYGTNAHSQGTTAFSLTSGSLPAGLTLNGSSGLLSGTPTSAGNYSFAVHLSDANGTAGTFTDDMNYSLTINPGGGGDSMPPSVPGGLQVTGTTTTSISLSWSPSTDNVAVQGYYIYRDGGGSPIGSTAATTFTDSGLNPGTSHSYTVTAYDAAANQSSHSGQVSGSTNPGGGTSGGASGGGGASSSGGSKLPAPTPAPAQPAPGNVDLDQQPGFNDGSGYTQDSSSGQTFSFTDSNNQTHVITVDQTSDGSADLSVDSTPINMSTGDTVKQDVNDDGHDDISITLNGVNGGKANLTFKKIIIATSPTGTTGNNGFGAGNTPQPAPARKHQAPLALRLIFPWLLFVLLGLSAARLALQSAKERRLAALYARSLEAEKALAEEKSNFVTLSQHYLRTPMTAIGNGIELINSLGPKPADSRHLTELSHRLSEKINILLAQAGRQPSESQPNRPGLVTPLTTLAPLTAGFAQISTLPAIIGTMIGTFVVVGMTDFIVKQANIYDVSLTNFLTQLAGMLAITIFFWAALRSHRKNEELRRRAERDLAQQQELNTARNTLIKNSLADLKPIIGELKNRLTAAAPANPAAAKPAMNGMAQLDGLVQKFTILAALESGGMTSSRQLVDTGQLAAQILGRYDAVLQAKNISIKNQVEPARFELDALLVSFAVDSLLSNAIKYSPAGAEIIIEGRHSRHGYEISVRDSGPGIDPQKQVQLFQPFSRAEDAARDFNVQGAGLSLYLDKILMDYLDGSIGLDSQLGRGTKVTLEVPA